MLICGLDLETTGLDPKKDHITEIGYVVKEPAAPKAGIMRSELLYNEIDYGATPISDEIFALTKISNEHLIRWGRPPAHVLWQFLLDTEKVDFFIAHNGMNFDRPFLVHKLKMHGFESDHPVFDPAKWLDSQADIEHPFKSTHLNYLAAEHGFLNPFPHAALSDVQTMLRIVEKHDILEIIARSRIPWVVVRAMTSFDQKELAKARRFRWQEPGNGKTYEKCWVKLVKADKVETEQAEAAKLGFKVVMVEGAEAAA